MSSDISSSRALISHGGKQRPHSFWRAQSLTSVPKERLPDEWKVVGRLRSSVGVYRGGDSSCNFAAVFEFFSFRVRRIVNTVGDHHAAHTQDLWGKHCEVEK